MSSPRPNVAFATCAHLPFGSPDDQEAARLAGAEFVVWDDPTIDWHAYGRVVLRSVWDYSRRPAEFLAWCTSVGPRRLRNSPDLVAFDIDKRYLGELGVRIAPTAFVGPGDRVPHLEGEVVVKPNVSAGARDTGRFAPSRHVEALALIERIRAEGRTAIVQSYLSDVDRHGETSLVFIEGQLSHVLRKRPVLRAQGEAPAKDTALGGAAVMSEDDLVVASRADAVQREFATTVLATVTESFGVPLYARVDIARDDQGPVLMELEAIEPCLYFAQAPGSSARFAEAVKAF